MPHLSKNQRTYVTKVEKTEESFKGVVTFVRDSLSYCYSTVGTFSHKSVKQTHKIIKSEPVLKSLSLFLAGVRGQ